MAAYTAAHGTRLWRPAQVNSRSPQGKPSQKGAPVAACSSHAAGLHHSRGAHLISCSLLSCCHSILDVLLAPQKQQLVLQLELGSILLGPAAWHGQCPHNQHCPKVKVHANRVWPACGLKGVLKEAQLSAL